MAWQGAADAPPTARIMALGPSLHPGEQRVAEAVAGDLAAAVEHTAQQVADEVGVGRATVIRTAQRLGYDGYPQLRVAVARELALDESAGVGADVDVGGAGAVDGPDGTMIGGLRASVDRFAARIGHTVTGITEESLQAFVGMLDEAQRVLIVSNGLSSPLGLDLMLRLNAVGRPAEMLSDTIAQQIAARQLGEGSVCVAVSGSGANTETLTVLDAARTSGARTLAITSFAGSPVAELVDTVLVVPSVNNSFRDELLHPSRAALMLVVEALTDALMMRRGDRGRDARAAVLDVLAPAIREE